MKKQTNFWNQVLTFRVWKSDWTKHWYFELNLSKNKKRFLEMAEKIAGQNFMWELSTIQNADEAIVIL